MTERFHGLISAVHTPFHRNGSVNYDCIPRQVAHVADAGFVGCFVCGTTGESTSLSVPERRQIAERWVAAAPPSIKVIAHVGHLCLEDARALAADAQRVGAFAIAAMPPCFLRPVALDDLVGWCRRVASAAPELPFYYYHIPSYTGVDFRMVDFLAAAADRVPTLAGVKFTHADFLDFGRCLDFDGGRYQILYGWDEMLLGALALGGTACIGGTYALAPSLYGGIVKAYREGDMAAAQKGQSRARDMIAAMIEAGGLPAMKSVMKMHGVDCGPVRPPLADIAPERHQRLREQLEALGVVPALEQ